MILFCKYFPKKFYCLFASRIPLYSKEGVRLSQKMIQRMLKYFEYLSEEPFPLGKILVCGEYFTKCLAKVLYCVLVTPTSMCSYCFVNPNPGSLMQSSLQSWHKASQ